MRIIVLLSGIVIYLLVLLLLGKVGKKTTRLSERLLLVEKQGEIESFSDDKLSSSFIERVLRPGAVKAIQYLGAILPMSENTAKALNEQLRQADNPKTAREYVAIRITIIGLTLLGVFLIAQIMAINSVTMLYLIGITVFSVYVFSRFFLTGNITKRKRQIEKEMPDIMDLLSVSVSAGLGFDQALLYVVERCNGALVNELSIAQKEISLGRTRAEALKRLASRCDVEALNIFVGAIIQAETLGIPISNVLKVQADNIRNLHRQKVEERAAKLPVKIILPLVFLVFPNLFLIVLGPAVPGIFASLGG